MSNNSLEEAAREFQEDEREKKKGSSDPKALDQYIAEHPYSPNEATLQVSANLFDIATLQEHYNTIKAGNLQTKGTQGRLYYKGENVELRDFGTWSTLTQKARLSRNPKTGEKVETPEKIKIRFKMSKKLFDKINNNE